MKINLIVFGWCLAFGFSYLANGNMNMSAVAFCLAIVNLGCYLWTRK